MAGSPVMGRLTRLHVTGLQAKMTVSYVLVTAAAILAATARLGWANSSLMIPRAKSSFSSAPQLR